MSMHDTRKTSNTDMLHGNEAFLDDFIEKMYEESYRIIDIFSKRVTEAFSKQYDAAISYFEKDERLKKIYKDYGEIFLILNCYFDMIVSFKEDAYETIDEGRDFMDRFTDMNDRGEFKVVFPKENIMIVLDRQDTYMTVYGNDTDFEECLEKLVIAKGYHLWDR